MESEEGGAASPALDPWGAPASPELVVDPWAPPSPEGPEGVLDLPLVVAARGCGLGRRKRGRPSNTPGNPGQRRALKHRRFELDALAGQALICMLAGGPSLLLSPAFLFFHFGWAPLAPLLGPSRDSRGALEVPGKPTESWCASRGVIDFPGARVKGHKNKYLLQGSIKRPRSSD